MTQNTQETCPNIFFGYVSSKYDVWPYFQKIGVGWSTWMILRWRSEVRVVENFWGKNRDAKNCKQFFANNFFYFYRITAKHSSFDAARGNDSWHFLFYFYNSRSFRNIDQKHPKIGPHFGRRPSIYSRIFDGQNWDWNMKKLKTRVLQPKHLGNLY